MARKRNKENRGLPPRWSFRSGAYYYVTRDTERDLYDGRKWFRLGSTLAEAHAEFAKRQVFEGEIRTIAELADRYELEVLPLNAPSTRRNKGYSLKRVRAVFGNAPVAAIQPKDIFKYKDQVAKKYSKKHYNNDHELLSHMFSQAIEWGVRQDHPMTGKKVTKFSLKARDRYVTDAELTEFRENYSSPFLNAYLELKGLTGLRKGDMLSIKLSDFQDGHLRVVPRKTANKKPRPLLFQLTPPMVAAIKAIKDLPRPVGSVWLFSTRQGQPYIDVTDGSTSGFDSIWQRRMQKFAKGGHERFTEHDLRAKVGSDEESTAEAQKLLHHSSAALTEKVYRRKGEVITPAKGFKRG
jgi:integrase